MEAQKYKRVLIKISGEALAGDKHFGLNFDVIGPVCDGRHLGFVGERARHRVLGVRSNGLPC